MSYLDIRTAVAQGAELLARAGIPEPRFTAELLLCYALGRERVYLFAHPEQELRQVEWLHYGRYLNQRMGGKPLQYITHNQEFFGREFHVSEDVLIPRPETELLVETVLKARRGFRDMQGDTQKTIIDIGTGSGAIAITIAIESEARVIATDISRGAIAVARANAGRLHANVEFVSADLLAPFRDEAADVIVCNPPYVPERDRDSLQREVREWEPGLALFGGAEGLDVYRRLIPQAAGVLKCGGMLALEIGFGQAEAVAEMAQGWNNIRTIPDLAGIPRVVVCENG